MKTVQTYDWSQFEVVFYYDESTDNLMQYWATPSGLESFFIEEAHFRPVAGVPRAAGEFVQAGDRYRWVWRHAFAVEGEILAVRKNEEISFTFGSMKVSVYFSQVGNQTELRLVQTEIPESDDGRIFGHLNCRSCWVFFLTNLKSVVATGLDLRDPNPERVSAMEVGFEPLSRRVLEV